MHTGKSLMGIMTRLDHVSSKSEIAAVRIELSAADACNIPHLQ